MGFPYLSSSPIFFSLYGFGLPSFFVFVGALDRQGPSVWVSRYRVEMGQDLLTCTVNFE